MHNSTRKRNNNNNNKGKRVKETYTNEDYSSNDGMLTSVWGPCVWHMLHTMSFNYPVQPTKEQKEHYRDFVLSLRNVLPCKHCRNNLHKNFATLPLRMTDMASRDSFSRYIYNLHELVNKMLDKHSGLTYEQVRERYEHFRARCTQSNVVVKHEKGCTESLHGEKAKCVIQIVPQTKKCNTFQMDPSCIKQRFSFKIPSPPPHQTKCNM
jgi:hypothetical protein